MKRIQIILAITSLVILACICGGTPTTPPEKVGEATAAPTVPTNQIYKIGDVIQTGSSTITLNSATFQGSIVDVNFTIENQGFDEIAISTVLQFSAKDDTGVKLEEEIFECSATIGGTIVPGDKTKGSVCYKGVATNTIKIYYQSEIFSSQTVVWEVSR